MSPTCQVAVVQHPPVFLNLPRSLERAVALTTEAARHGAQLIAFPETWLPGYPVWLDLCPQAALFDHPPAQALHQALVENSVAIPGPELAALANLAGELRVHLVMGLHERQGGTLYNTMVFLAPDGSYRLHRKLMPTYTERLIWGQGDGSTLCVIDTEHGRLGGLICWEHFMPLARAAMHARREDIHVAQWPTVRELHQIASRHYAFEGQTFVLCAGCVLTRGDVLDGAAGLPGIDPAALHLLSSIPGGPEALLQRGGSAVVAPDASYLAGPVFDRPCILYGELTPGLRARGHLLLDVDGHYARPDIFSLEVDERPRANVTFRR